MSASELYSASSETSIPFTSKTTSDGSIEGDVISSEVMTPIQDALQTQPDAQTLSTTTSIIDTETSSSAEASVATQLQETIIPDHAAQTVDGRLLCASQCAYGLTQPYFRASAYRPATVAKRISRGVNSVIIGQTYDGITIAFRGTQTSNPLDWIQNAALFLTPVGGGAIKGKIHTGFYRATKSLWKPLKAVLKDMLENCEKKGWKKDVYFTGHSKGGAMATVAALLMKRDTELPDPTYVCTFASAKVGDSEFRDFYNERVNQTSYEAHLDVIPLLPPSEATMETMNDELTEMVDSMLWSEASSKKKEKYKWDYQTVGRRKFIDEFGMIVDDITRQLDEKRIDDIQKAKYLSLEEFRASHCSSCPDDGCYGYYFKAVAGSVCNLCHDEENEMISDRNDNV